MDESADATEQSTEEQQDEERYLEDLPDGAGCVEIWDRIADYREDD
ncbi:hypothetical protein [Halomontanus rarus]|nr:hypothetical protein [Halovivax sp. TS33]